MVSTLLGLLPELKTLYEKHKDKGFEIVGVNIDEELASVQEFMKKDALPWTVVRSVDANAPDAVGFKAPFATEIGVNAIPMVLIVDREGKRSQSIFAKMPLSKRLNPLLRLPDQEFEYHNFMYLQLAKRLLLETDKRLLWKLAYNAGWKGLRSVLKHKARLKRGEFFPPFLYISVINTCNLRCQGCWVDVAGKQTKIDLASMNRLITEAKPWAIPSLAFSVANRSCTKSCWIF